MSFSGEATAARVRHAAFCMSSVLRLHSITARGGTAWRWDGMGWKGVERSRETRGPATGDVQGTKESSDCCSMAGSLPCILLRLLPESSSAKKPSVPTVVGCFHC